MSAFGTEKLCAVGGRFRLWPSHSCQLACMSREIVLGVLFSTSLGPEPKTDPSKWIIVDYNVTIL